MNTSWIEYVNQLKRALCDLSQEGCNCGFIMEKR